jgi:hypothetical protein
MRGKKRDASLSDLEPLVGPSTAKRFIGSLAKEYLDAADKACAPVDQAFESATTWSICTASEVLTPLTKLIVLPVYGSFKTPVVTLHQLLEDLVMFFRSLVRM